MIKQTVRRLVHTPVFTVVSLLTIAIAVGANTAVFSVLDFVLLKPLPYPEPEQLVGVWQGSPPLKMPKFELSPSEYFTFREENRTLSDFGFWEGGTASVTGLAEPEQVRIISVTDGTLQALRVQPSLGRWFSADEYAPGAPDKVIVTHGFWQRKFGGAPSAVGQMIHVSGRPRQIVGIMPAAFRFLDRKPELILPIRLDRSRTVLGQFNYQSIGRLKPGVTLQGVTDDIARMMPIVHERFPPPSGFSLKMFIEAGIRPNVLPLKQDVLGDIGKVLWVLMATIGIVLLIACANVANLLLVRAEGRQQELAIRTALGASRGVITRELLFESVFLGMAGGAMGIGLASAALRFLVSLGPASLPRLDTIAIDAGVLLFAFALSIASGLLFGLVPVLKYGGAQLLSGLRGSTRSATHSRERHRARNTLVVVQVALALVLLVASGLMIRTFAALKNVQPGFTHPDQLQTARISISDAELPDAERVARMQNEIIDKISSIAGVASVAVTNSVPTDGYGGGDPLFAEDRTYTESEVPPIRRFKFVGPDYFRTLGNAVIAGRELSWTDIYEKRAVVLVSENVARAMWQSPDAALGKRVRQSKKGPWREIVGVVGDIRDEGADQPAPGIVYFPFMMADFWDNMFVNRNVAFAIRSPRAGSEDLIKEIRDAVWSVDSNLPVSSVRTLEEVYSASMARTSFTLIMLAIAGGMALLLGLIGIYGVMSYSVSQRTREIGIRIALGAHQRDVKGQFVRHGLLLAAIGSVFGLIAAAAATRLMSSLLFTVKPIDPLTYIVVAAGLITASAAASYIPARRATRVDPASALRNE